MKISRFCLSAVAGLVLTSSFFNGAAARAAGDVVWLEGESPASITPAGFKIDVGNGPAAVLSQGKWLAINLTGDAAKTFPEEGVAFQYDFDATQAADYAAWIHVGYEQARAPFDWKIDDGAWQEIASATPTVDVQELGIWAPVAWLQLGKQQLAAGHHSIALRVHKTKGKPGTPDSVLFGADAICLTTAAFHPDGAIKPNDVSWMSDADKSAAAQVFAVPVPNDAAQAALSLKGTWQYAGDDELTVEDRLGPTKAIPDTASLTWHSISVPGDRNKLLPTEKYVHRFYLQTRVNVPAELNGRSFVLHVPDVNMIATLFVNGQKCGWTKALGAAWDCDITAAIKPGQANEIQIAIKDAFYGLDIAENNGHLRYVPYDFWHFNLCQRLDMPVLAQYFAGLWRNEPSLIVAGKVYASDIFAKPSVKDKALGLEVTLHNPTDQPIEASVTNEIEPLAGGAAEKTFAPTTSTVPAGQDAVVQISEAWANAKLWWPDDPQQYVVVTRVSAGVKVIDERRTKFGFREWTCDGPDFKLNGIPWHGFADINKADIATLKKRGQNMVRVWQPDENTDAYLDECDAQGMCVRRTGIFDGEGAAGLYRLDNPALWENYRQQMVPWIKSQRNHPSIFIWSVENEITFINGHVRGQDKLTTQEIKKTFDLLCTIDPTRPQMTDGGNALLDESMPVYGGHYMEAPLNRFPEAIYDRDGYTHRQVWPIAQAKPVLLGESAYLPGNTPAELATVGGEEASTGKAEAAPARGTILRMLSEGYRWVGFSFHFWTNDAADYYNSWSPTAVFCRQWDWTFNSGQSVKRTMGIFNDTRSNDPITYTAVLTLHGKEVSRDTSTHTVAPGGNEKFDVMLTLPAVTERQEGTWALTLTRGANAVFQDVKNVSVMPPPSKIFVTPPKAGSIALYDPKGDVKHFLQSAGTTCVGIDNLKQIPASAKVLIIGNDALDAETATSSQLAAWASAGRVLVVLEQKNPIKFQGLPGEMETAQNNGCLTFAEDLTSPVFDGIAQRDLSSWGPDNWSYRDAYLKPVSGGKSLVQCDFRLSNSALVQMQADTGIMLLSQLLIGEKIKDNAVAQRLLMNMVKFGLDYKSVYRETTVVADTYPQLRKILDAAGLQYGKLTDVNAAISKPGSIAVIDANPANLSALASQGDKVKSFTTAGGWIVLSGLTPDGLADFNKLVGVDHIIRPFHSEKVTLSASRNPLIAGLPASNVVMGSGKAISRFAAGEFPDANAYGYVVDLDEVAPFGTSTYYGWGNAVNGFTQKDGAWQLIQNLPPSNAVIPIKLPRPEKIEQIVWCSDTNYQGCKKIEVSINGKAYPFDTQPNGDEQTFAIPDEPTAMELSIRITDWEHDPAKMHDGQELVGIDNIWIKVARSTDFSVKVKPMLNIGSLVEYPQGKGGISLCNVKFRDHEENPENMTKKRAIISTLLRNLQARFTSGPKVIAGANLQFNSVDISSAANQFRGEQGWFGDKKHTFEALPRGKQLMAGINYDVYDFKTSIVPEVVMLKGRGIPGNLPEKVLGIPVKKKADALFFLQAAHIETRLSDRDRKAGKRNEMADYIVHFANGTTEKIPVYSEINVDDYYQKEPTPILGAQIAWQRSYGPTDGYAVAYSMQWNNPHPEVAIESIDLVPGTQRCGTPALLALTAATKQ